MCELSYPFAYFLLALSFTRLFDATTYAFPATMQRRSVASGAFNSMQKLIKQRHYCGSDLPKAVSEVCQGKYNGFPFYDNERYITGQNQYLRPHLRRMRRAITEECCQRPCGEDTLLLYCDFDDEEYYREKQRILDKALKALEQQLASSTTTTQSSTTVSVTPPASSASSLRPPHASKQTSKDRRRSKKNRHIKVRNKKTHHQHHLHRCHRDSDGGGKTGAACRCRRRNRRGKKENKSFELGIVSSAESNPHLIHDFSHHSHFLSSTIESVQENLIKKMRPPNNQPLF